jgi:DNA processing protein
MMNKEDIKTNLPYILALNRMPHFNLQILLWMIKIWPQLKDMFQASFADLLFYKLPEKLILAIKKFDFRCVDQDLDWQTRSASHYLLTCFDEHYPSLLKEIDYYPPILYAEGVLSHCTQPAVSMVGTRHPSTVGLETAWRFAKELAEEGVMIVSGLALGIDTEAHRGCLAGEGRTIAVLGTGIDRVYPSSNWHLTREIANNGLLMSEFPLNSPPRAGHFPLRNRIISGLSSITVVVEAALRSGSLITARYALEQNRDVLAVPGAIHNPKARGCLFLLQQGAKLAMSSRDVLDELGISPASDTMVREEKMLKNKNKLASPRENLVKCMGYEMISIDELVKRSGLSMTEVMCYLAELEIRGEVISMLGNYVRVIR